MVILQKKVPGVTQAALEKFLTRARRAVGLDGDVNLLVTNDGEIRLLNRRFRGKDETTDVLSFPSLAVKFPGRRNQFAGDIAISADIAAENAAHLGHTPGEEIKILALHGILHLAGLDHERDNGTMARKEAQLRQLLRLPSALIERLHSGTSHSAKKKRGSYRAGASRA